MSGGSMNYLYSKIEYDATFSQNTPERRAFAKHLVKVAKALHDIEWVDSADYGPGDDTEAIRACLGDALILEAAIEQAEEAVKVLKAEIDRAIARRKGGYETQSMVFCSCRDLHRTTRAPRCVHWTCRNHDWHWVLRLDQGRLT